MYRKSQAFAQAEQAYMMASPTNARAKLLLANLYHHMPYSPPKMTQKQVDQKIVELYTAAGKGGEHLATFLLGIIFAQGFRSIPKNPTKALALFMECVTADRNVKTNPSEAAIKACFGIGQISSPSQLKMKNPLGFTTKLQWYTFGAKHGDQHCQGQLAEMYYEGIGGLKQDYALASHWLNQCLKQGHHPGAVSQLGKMQHRGVFVRPPESDEEDE